MRLWPMIFWAATASGFVLGVGDKRPTVKALGALDDPMAMLAEAERLRREAAIAEASLKEETAGGEKPLKKKKLLRITLPMSKPDWSVVEEEVEFLAIHDLSTLLRLDVPLPCGILFEEDDDKVIVVEVAPNSNAALAGVQEGDILRATSAVRAQMELPTWQLLGGGIGRPKFFRFIYGADLAGPPRRSFEEVLAAVASNRDQNRPALLVLERLTTTY